MTGGVGLRGLAFLAVATIVGCADRVDRGRDAHAQSVSLERLFLGATDRRDLLLPEGERREVRSLLHFPRALRYGEFRWEEKGVPAGPVWIRVDLDAQVISVFRGPHEIGSGAVLYGADSHPTPKGRFPILKKLQFHRSSLYDGEMPFTLRLTDDGIAIHGSDVRAGLATHGCIGIPEEFAHRIFMAVTPGDLVYVVSSRNRT